MVRIGSRGAASSDPVVVEEPLEIRVAGEPVAVTMRTPGHDRELALGFLFAEGIVTSLDDVGSLAHCGRPGDEGYGNAIDVAPGPGTSLDVERIGASRRGTLTNASCGVCGRRSIDDLLARCPRLHDETRVPAALVAHACSEMREGQANFAKTGGLHAAAIYGAGGERLALFEDVGRHNAVDKAVGALLLAGKLPLPFAVLAVSGRASFEIVQKAAAARIALVASVSAPSSLAIDLAERAGITLVGFVRGETMNVYAGAGRVGG